MDRMYADSHIERKKADRLAKQIQKQIDLCEDLQEKERLEGSLHVANVDALYARYFPYRERYVSLYRVAPVNTEEKNDDGGSAAKALGVERPPLWSSIEKVAEEGTPALIQFRERKPTTVSKTDTSEGKSATAETDGLKPRKVSTARSADTRTASTATQDQKKRRSNNPPTGPSEDGHDSEDGFFEED
jgi:hypothetical protein